ncbi:MAG TPA: DUF3301 domain-containing protein [Steroidobacteraceae bacterium]|nr:DUF3301 domain-containing protein [Steroidobacteraceae bacterium]
MELTWGGLLLLGVLGAAAWFWFDSLGAREHANEMALETCRSTGASLLEGTVSFRSMRAVRPPAGGLRLERTYVFDYSLDGVTRRQGFIVLTGRQVDSIGLE